MFPIFDKSFPVLRRSPPHYLLSSCASESAEFKFIKQFTAESLVSVAELLFFIPIIALFLSNSNNRQTPPFNPVGMVHRGQQQPHGVEVQLFLTQPLASSRTRQPITPVASGITHDQLHGEARSQSIGRYRANQSVCDHRQVQRGAARMRIM